MSVLEFSFYLHFIRKRERQKHVAAIQFHVILMLNCLVPNKGELVFYKSTLSAMIFLIVFKNLRPLKPGNADSGLSLFCNLFQSPIT